MDRSFESSQLIVLLITVMVLTVLFYVLSLKKNNEYKFTVLKRILENYDISHDLMLIVFIEQSTIGIQGIIREVLREIKNKDAYIIVIYKGPEWRADLLREKFNLQVIQDEDNISSVLGIYYFPSYLVLRHNLISRNKHITSQ